MPYKNIHWVKLEIRLLHDPRFFTLSAPAQLIYVKFLLLCASFKNKVPRKYPILRELLRTEHTEAELDKLIDEIKTHFPKVLATKDFYYIRGFSEHTNWVSPGNSQGNPEELLGAEQNKIRVTVIKELRKKVIATYIRLKGWDITNMVDRDYARINQTINRLLKRTEDADLILAALEWASKLNWNGWTIEYVDKHWLEFMKHNNQGTPAASKEVDLSHLGK